MIYSTLLIEPGVKPMDRKALFPIRKFERLEAMKGRGISILAGKTRL